MCSSDLPVDGAGLPEVGAAGGTLPRTGAGAVVEGTPPLGAAGRTGSVGTGFTIGSVWGVFTGGRSLGWTGTASLPLGFSLGRSLVLGRSLGTSRGASFPAAGLESLSCYLRLALDLAASFSIGKGLESLS